jgi:ATP-dependent Clp protease ATP-binding subunit ClpC
MFERFTDRARRVIVLAQDDARRLNHEQIGAEHLLLGLADAGEGVAVRTLERFGVTPSTVRADVESRLEPGEPARAVGHIPFAAQAKKVLELSLREAIELGHRHIGTEHFLLGLLRQPECLAADILRARGVEHERARLWIAESVDDDAAGETKPRGPIGRPGRGQNTLRERFDRIESRLSELTARLEALERRVQG